MKTDKKLEIRKRKQATKKAKNKQLNEQEERILFEKLKQKYEPINSCKMLVSKNRSRPFAISA